MYTVNVYERYLAGTHMYAQPNGWFPVLPQHFDTMDTCTYE